MEKGDILAILFVLTLAVCFFLFVVKPLKDAEGLDSTQRARCFARDGKFGFGDVGYGTEPMCMVNGFPLTWHNDSWQMILPLFEVSG